MKTASELSSFKSMPSNSSHTIVILPSYEMFSVPCIFCCCKFPVLFAGRGNIPLIGAFTRFQQFSILQKYLTASAFMSHPLPPLKLSKSYFLAGARLLINFCEKFFLFYFLGSLAKWPPNQFEQYSAPGIWW